MYKMFSLIMLVAGLVFLGGCSREPSDQETALDTGIALESNDTSNAVSDSPVAEGEPVSGSTTVSDSYIPASGSVSAPAPVAASSETPTVKEIQRALSAAGLYNGKVDGVSGPRTKKAIKDFQAANGLNADGKVGAKTWGKLKANLSSQMPVAVDSSVSSGQ